MGRLLEAFFKAERSRAAVAVIFVRAELVGEARI